ncbi:MAG: DUF5986 family protein [Lachnospiraceae bacterium]|jgi:hypothetical protein|nr:DUF5986 family protein [Lachnospiraceae bacterium]
MPKFKSLDISNDAKHAITHGIFSAITHDIPDLIQEHGLPTAIGFGQARWNWIHKRVSENLEGRFQVHYAPRGAWKAMLLYENNLGFTFSIMSEKNFTILQKHLPKNVHYIESLISKNTGYDVIQGQMRLAGCDHHRNPSDVEKLRNMLLTDFAGIIKNHILILFDYNFNRVVSMRAILLTPQFDIAFDEDWSNFLKTPYIIGKTSFIEDMIDDDSEPIVCLKPKKQKESLDDLVSIPSESEIAN